MPEDPASLSNLRDIVTPPPVSWRPLALGWWLLLAAAAAVILFFALLAWRRWRANAYRRAALRELQAAGDAAAIAEVLKRTALVAGSRVQVASLSGERWVDWLAETGGRPVPAAVRRALAVGVFARNEGVDIPQLSAFAVDWIRHHQVTRPC